MALFLRSLRLASAAYRHLQDWARHRGWPDGWLEAGRDRLCRRDPKTQISLPLALVYSDEFDVILIDGEIDRYYGSFFCPL
jgi:hypothetical protein